MNELGRAARTRIIFFVDDFQQAVAFYEDVLGLPLAYPAGHGWAEFALEGTCALCLHEGRQSVTSGAPSATFGWAVSDLDAAVAALRARGVETEDPHVVTEGLRSATFHDPSGNALFFEGP